MVWANQIQINLVLWSIAKISLFIKGGVKEEDNVMEVVHLIQPLMAEH